MSGNSVEGRVDTIGPNGDLITDIAVSQCAGASNILEVRVAFGPHETIGIHPADNDEPDSTLIAIANENGCIEIGIKGMHLSEMLGIQAGQSVTISW